MAAIVVYADAGCAQEVGTKAASHVPTSNETPCARKAMISSLSNIGRDVTKLATVRKLSVAVDACLAAA